MPQMAQSQKLCFENTHVWRQPACLPILFVLATLNFPGGPETCCSWGGGRPAGSGKDTDCKYRCATLRVQEVLSLLDLPVPRLCDHQKHLGGGGGGLLKVGGN